MDEGTARSVATAIIRPCGLLGYLVGRGTWWSTDEYLERGKRAVGQVMGSAYHLLIPVWQLHPSLDPGQASDALHLAQQSTSLQDTRDDLMSLLADLESAVRWAAPVLEEHLPASRDHIRRAVPEVDRLIRAAQQVLSATGSV